MADDPYKVLGVPEGAGDIAIKRAYRREMFKLHPDTGTGDTEAIQKIREAYELLLDKDKRAKYDKVRKIFEDDEKEKKDRGSQSNSPWSGVWNGGPIYTGGSSGSSYTVNAGTPIYASGSMAWGSGFYQSYQAPTTVRARATYAQGSATPLIKVGDTMYYSQSGGLSQQPQAGSVKFRVISITKSFVLGGLQSYDLDLQQIP